MASVSFTYDYPYFSFGEKGRYQIQWATSERTLNGCYTYPAIFNTTVPYCKHIKVEVEIENTGSGTVLNRSWDFMVCKSNGSWVDIKTFTMPSDGVYTLDCDVGYSISQFAFLPSSNPGSSRTWNTTYTLEKLTVTETLTLNDLSSGLFQYGVFANYYGVTQRLNEVYVNIDGVLKPSTDIRVNVDGTLKSLPPVYSAHITTTSDAVNLFSFTPSESGTYKVCQKVVSGDHEIRFYDKAMAPLTERYFYSQSFSLTAGTLYYITVTQYHNTASGESYLQIYKED